jgi:hypothetical protein
MGTVTKPPACARARARAGGGSAVCGSEDRRARRGSICASQRHARELDRPGPIPSRPVQSSLPSASPASLAPGRPRTRAPAHPCACGQVPGPGSYEIAKSHAGGLVGSGAALPHLRNPRLGSPRRRRRLCAATGLAHAASGTRAAGAQLQLRPSCSADRCVASLRIADRRLESVGVAPNPSRREPPHRSCDHEQRCEAM